MIYSSIYMNIQQHHKTCVSHAFFTGHILEIIEIDTGVEAVIHVVRDFLTINQGVPLRVREGDIARSPCCRRSHFHPHLWRHRDFVGDILFYLLLVS
uniref:Uncharacterized protein n=1 Tax=Arundo donax TaxID=35708 RepID=A0A0A9HNA2_ARUDO